MSYLLGEYHDNIIREGRRYRSLILCMPQIITVTNVNDTEVQFSRKGISGISMMPIEQFIGISVPLEGLHWEG